MSVKELKGEDVSKLLLDGGVVLVKFYAPWCGHCRRIAPIYQTVADETSNKAVFCSVNGDENEDIMSEYDIEVYPTILFFKDGKKQDALQGEFSKEKIIDKINSL